MIRRDEVHIRVTVVGLTSGDPPTITVSRAARRLDGKERTFVQKLPTPADLFARLLSQVQEGEEIEAVIVTEWHKTGYTTRLCDFHAVATLASNNVRVT